MTTIRGKSALDRALTSRIEAMRANSPAQNRAFLRIGMVVSARAKYEIRAKDLISTGALLNSIQYRIGAGYVSIGSFGVPYARSHEFGDVVPEAKLVLMRKAWFAKLKQNRGAVRIKGDGNFSLKTGIIRERPFLRPAFEGSRDQILKIIEQELLRGKK